MKETDDRSSPTAYFLRHGETSWNVRGLCVGNADVPLTEKGLLQAAESVSQVDALPIDSIITSPLTRARKTASIIASRTKHSLCVESGFAECNFGVWQGHPEGDLSLYRGWRSGHTPADGEPFLKFCNRVSLAFDRAISTADCPLIVAHTGVYWAIMTLFGETTWFDIDHAVPYQLSTARN